MSYEHIWTSLNICQFWSTKWFYEFQRVRNIFSSFLLCNMNFDNSHTFEKTHISPQHVWKSCILAFYIIQSAPNTNINKTHIKARKTKNSRQRKESPTSQKISNICVEQFCEVECKTSDDATVMSICFTNTAIFSLS